jgi:hypothetical protein
MYSAFPSGAVRFDVAFGALLERHRAGAVGDHLRLPAVALVNRVDAVDNEQVGRDCFLPGIRERHARNLTETHLSGAAGNHEPEHPSLRVAVADLEVEPVPVAVESRPEVPALHEFNGQFSHLQIPSSDKWLYNPTHKLAPGSIAQCRMGWE